MHIYMYYKYIIHCVCMLLSHTHTIANIHTHTISLCYRHRNQLLIGIRLNIFYSFLLKLSTFVYSLRASLLTSFIRDTRDHMLIFYQLAVYDMLC